MLWCLWGAKGGSGCSVTTAAAALRTARRNPVLLVDLGGGDLSHILGVPPSRPGLARWLRHPNPPPDSLARIEVPVADRLALLPFPDAQPGGRREVGGDDLEQLRPDPRERVHLLAHLLAADERTVVVDLGLAPAAGPSLTGSGFAAFISIADRSTLVTRLCYIGLRAALERPVPDDVIIVAEPDRALRPSDVTAALGVGVSVIRWDPAVARAVDAGLLAQRLPRALSRIPLPARPSAQPTGGSQHRAEVR